MNQAPHSRTVEVRAWLSLACPRLVVLGLVILLGCPSGSGARAATLTVNSTNDSGPGSLRLAIQSAAAGDIINFAITGTITLTNGELLVTNSLTITGPGATNLALNGNNTGRILEIGTNVVASVSGLALIQGSVFGAPGTNNSGGPGGNASPGLGGGILNAGTLSLANCIVSGCSAWGSAGGGGSPVGNSAPGSGGGIWNGGNLLLSNCTVSNNSAFGLSYPYPGGTQLTNGGNASGGGLYNAGTLTLTNSRVAGNNAYGGNGDYGGAGANGDGGGVVNIGTLLASGCAFSSNFARGGAGGGGGGYFVPNVPGGPGGQATGGAIHNEGSFTLNNCTLNANSATGGGGGGAGANTGFGGPGSASAGGGLWSSTTFTSTLTNCTFSGNLVRGGDGGSGFAGRHGGPGADGIGGGININGPGWMLNCTVTTNSAIGGAPGPNSPTPPPGGNGIGGGIASGGPMNLRNTIVAGNSSDVAGTFVNQGNNLVGPLDPRLGPLQDNGGPTLTHALLYDSPAIDAGASIGAPALDQRSVSRPQGLGVDVGAFEAIPAAPALTALSASQEAEAGTNLVLYVTATGTLPLRYQWFKEGGLLNGATNATFALHSVQPADAGSYTVAISNYVSGITSPPIAITVRLSPLITTQPRTQSVVADSSAIFTVLALGIEPLTYQWRFTGANIPAATSNLLVLSHVQPSATGAYDVVVSNPAGVVTSSVATLTIWPTLTVSNTNDAGAGSLRQAILDANAGGPAERRDIVCTNLSGAIILNSNLPAISVNSSLRGPGANRLVLRGGGLIYSAGTTNTVSGLTLANGPGISNSGSLFISNCVVRDNSGHGIYSALELTLVNSTVSGNQANGSAGGGIYDPTCQTPCPGGGPGFGAGLLIASGRATLVNSTVSGNTARGGAPGMCYFACPPGPPGQALGGGIYVGGDVTLVNCTVVNNQLSGFYQAGGGIYVAGGRVSLENTLIAGNSPTEVNGPVLSQGHNLIGSTNGSSGWMASDLSGLDPKLGPLQPNGGPTFTMALLPGSPAIDAADDSALGPPFMLTTDQRGLPRKSGPHVDIGAFEFQAASLPLYLSTLIRLNQGTVQIAFTNAPGASFTTLSSTNLSIPLSNWSVLGAAEEIGPGQFQFLDVSATNQPARFYRLRSP